MRAKIFELFNNVKMLEEVSSKVAGESKKAANEASAGLTASYSAAGDAEHAKNTADLSIQKLESIKKLSKELEKMIESSAPDSIQPATHVLIKYKEGIEKELYLVENPIYIAGFSLISPKSLLGEALVGKKVGEDFSFISGDQKFEGEILEIE